MTSRRLLISCLIAVSLAGCIEEYQPAIEDYENLLVVDGIITNEKKIITIKLSRSSAISSSDFYPEKGASLVIADNQGTVIALHESLPGIYQTVSPAQPVSGRLYQLQIKLSNGKQYASGFELLAPPVKISQVTFEQEIKPGHELLHDLEGLQFFVDSQQTESDSSYLVWGLTETYEYKSDFKIKLYFDGTIKPFPRPDSLQTCWKTERIPQIFASRTEGLTQPMIRHFPLHYVNTESRKLYLSYSLLVRQYTLSRQAWEFWDQVREQSEAQGGLYQTQPYQIVGNVKNINNKNEAVLGQFTVAAVDSVRLFVNRAPFNYYFDKCVLSEADIENFSAITEFPPESWPIYATTTPDGAAALPLQDCLDCRLKGGTTQKPVFWINN